jgi:putative membrane protein
MKTVKTSMFKAGVFFLSLAFASFNAHAQQPKLTDPEIASVGVTANQIDINAGELALKKTKSSDVRNFANTMINDHKAVIAQAVALVTKLKVTPQDNAVSKKLMADAEKTKAELQKKSGKAFDKAYINNEVAYHKAVISAVEKLLIPQTTNEELKQLLQNILPALRTHLEHAEMLQKKYK